MRVVKQFVNEQGDPFKSVYTDHTQSLLMDFWTAKCSDANMLSSAIIYSNKQIKSKGLSCWLLDITPIKSDFKDEASLLADMVKHFLPELSLKKFALLARSQTEPSCRGLIEVFRQHSVQVEVFSTHPAGIEWLVVPEVDEPIWDAQPQLSF